MTSEQLDALVATKYALLSSQKIFKQSVEDVLLGIREEVKALAKLADPIVYSRRSEFFNLTGIKPEEYTERIIEIPRHGFVLAGIRFRGLAVTKPFVSVLPAFHLTSNNLSEVATSMKFAFRSFRPSYFQVTLPPKHLDTGRTVEVDRHTVAGEIAAIINFHSGPREIELLAPEDIDFYPRYLQEYEIFHQHSPDLKSEVRPETIDDLQESLNEGLLYKVMRKGVFAGVIAGIRSDYHGLAGVNVLEELVFSEFRGQGFGVQTQNEFARKLEGRAHILWGTILAKNIPSLKTALNNGRVITETDYLVHLLGTSGKED